MLLYNLYCTGRVKVEIPGYGERVKGKRVHTKDISPLHSGTKYHGCPNIYDI